jgi:hypothetical protein
VPKFIDTVYIQDEPLTTVIRRESVAATLGTPTFVTSAMWLTTESNTWFINAINNNITVELPVADGFIGELIITRMDSSNYRVLVVPQATETISKGSSIQLYPYETLSLISDANKNWWLT